MEAGWSYSDVLPFGWQTADSLPLLLAHTSSASAQKIHKGEALRDANDRKEDQMLMSSFYMACAQDVM